eukprot:11352092-Alexandrium_andersonii.AAC.1
MQFCSCVMCACVRACFLCPAVWQELPINDLPSPLLWEARLPGKLKDIGLVIAVGHKLFLVNHGDNTVLIPVGTVLAGYYKGKWWHQKPDGGEEAGPADVPFQVRSSADICNINGKHTTVGAVIEAKRAVAPKDVTVAYHDLQDAPMPDEPGHFNLKVKHLLNFKCTDIPATLVKTEGEDTKKMVNAGHIAGVIPVSCWTTACTGVSWSVRWPPVASKGLTPIRPMIVATRDITINANVSVQML